MTITAKVIAHSRHEGAPDLITMQVRYPRFIHAEAKTHRVIRIDDAEYEFLQEVSFMDDENLSRNASSSRAIPVERMIQDVLDDPAMPVRWGANQPGMQDAGDHNAKISVSRWDDRGKYFEELTAEESWIEARDNAVQIARAFTKAGYHKQVANRLLEPFGHISVVVTATDWDNFFDLRCHEAADPTMRALAEAMRDAIQASVAKTTGFHLPYICEFDLDYVYEATGGDGHQFDRLAMISAARCARVSYLNHDGSSPNIEKDIALADMLSASKHMSPFEHQAWTNGTGARIDQSGNLRDWFQFRKTMENRTCV